MSGSRIDRALQARTRKTAWKASSAWWVTQELAADVQDHGPVPRHQCGEGGFAGGVAPIVEPLDELAVGQARRRSRRRTATRSAEPPMMLSQTTYRQAPSRLKLARPAHSSRFIPRRILPRC